jgi:hypothetical protein
MNGILKGVRPLDYVLAAVMTAAGAYLMYENVVAAYGDGLTHAQSSKSWAMLPAFVLVTLPILWRRRNILAVTGVTTAAAVGHVLAFGWNTRCGVALPLSVALAYAIGRFAGSRRSHAIGLVGVVVLQLVVLVRDTSIDGIAGALVLSLPAAALGYGIGLVVQSRVTRKQSAEVTPLIERAAA